MRKMEDKFSRSIRSREQEGCVQRTEPLEWRDVHRVKKYQSASELGGMQASKTGRRRRRDEAAAKDEYHDRHDNDDKGEGYNGRE